MKEYKKYSLEEQLAQKLGQRSIAPGPGAWERVAHNRRPAKDKGKRVWWYSIAASVVLLLGIGYAFFNTQDDVSNRAVPVTVSKTTPKENKTSDTNPAVMMPQTAEPVQPAYVQHAVKAEKETEPQREFTAALSRETREMPAHIDFKLDTTIRLDNSMYDSEADGLLKRATRELAESKSGIQPTNDTLLLSEVEKEMDEYHREKAIKFFSLKYKKIRIALSDSN